MKILVLALIVLLFAACAHAVDVTRVKVPGDFILSQMPPGAYCQPFSSTFFDLINASTGFGSEVADDIPDSLSGMLVDEVVFWLGKESLWTNPDGVYLRFYNGECPPPAEAATVFQLAWFELQKTAVYVDSVIPYIVYQCVAELPTAVEIQPDMSISFQAITPWGAHKPMVDIGLTDQGSVYSDCEAYWYGTFWHYDSWVPITEVGEVPYDVAYCLSQSLAGVEPHSLTWGAIKALYR